MRFRKALTAVSRYTMGAILLLCFEVGAACAQVPEVNVSGFGDVFCSAPVDSVETPFALGQAEIDIRAALRGNIDVSAALAYDNSTAHFGLGEFFVEFRLWGVEENHLRPARGITHSGILAGQFDVPFGIDWEVYASIDRKLVTAPLVVENTHNFWNDTGIQVHAAGKKVSGVLYMVNGFGYDNVDMRHASGGRLALRPFGALEIGGSWAGFVRPGGDLDMSLSGCDAHLVWRGLSLKGEYVTRKTGLAGDAEATRFGWYAEGLSQAGRLFLVTRYDSYTPDGSGEDTVRTSLGAGWALTNGCEVRVEHQFRPDEEDNRTFLQVAAGF